MSERAGGSATAFWGDADEVEAPQRYRALADAIDGGIYQLDAAGRFVAVDDVLVELTGDAREDLVGEHVSALAADGGSRLDREVDRLLTDRPGRTGPLELAVRTAGGERVPCEVRMSPLEDDGDVAGVVGIVREVGERSRPDPDDSDQERPRPAGSDQDRPHSDDTDRDRPHSDDTDQDRPHSDDTDRDRPHSDDTDRDRSRVVQALEAAREGISLLDENGEFAYVNDAYADTFGYDPGEMIGEHWDELGIEADPDRVYEEVLPTVADEGQWTGTTTCVRRDDATFLARHSLTQTEDDELICVVRDVTEQRKREQLEAELDDVFDRISDAFYAVDDEWRFTHVNERAEELVGHTEEELLGETLWDRFPDATDTVVWEDFHAAMETNETRRHELYYEPLDAWIEQTAYPSDTGLSVYFRDVTERRERERDLREARERLEVATRAGSVGTWSWDVEADVVTADEYLAESYGMDPEAAAEGAPMEEFYDPIHEDDHERAWERLREAVEETGELEVEYRVRDADGELRWVVARGEVEYDDGEPVRVNGAITDITERKEYERRIEESERRYRTLVENFPDGAVGLFDEELRYTAVGGQLFDETDVPRDERIGHRVTELYPDDLVEAVEPHFRAALDGEANAFEVEYRGRHLRAHTLPIEDGDEVSAGMLVVQDVTDRVERERKLEERNERLDSFASMLAHELRNPVTIGQIYGRQLSDESGAGSDSDAVDYVVEAFDRIEEMIDVMLVLTRGRDAVGDRTRVQLDGVAREAWDDVDAPEATLTIEVDRTIQADETYVRHLFRNLFENSVEHGSTSSRPSADDAVEHGDSDVTVTVGDLPDGFYVADDGVGIPAEEREDVFEAGHTTAAGQGGTGLGLAFVRELADVYGWECAATESPAGGAQFEFRDVDGGAE